MRRLVLCLPMVRPARKSLARSETAKWLALCPCGHAPSAAALRCCATLQCTPANTRSCVRHTGCQIPERATERKAAHTLTCTPNQRKPPKRGMLGFSNLGLHRTLRVMRGATPARLPDNLPAVASNRLFSESLRTNPKYARPQTTL
jgi:hypothetical protein